MSLVDASQVADFLAAHPPFDALSRESAEEVAAHATVTEYADGDLVLDAFAGAIHEVCIVVSGTVALWHDAAGFDEPADQIAGPGDVFGFSAMLTERSVGPRAAAVGPATVLRVDGHAAAPAFASRRGARFLAEQVAAVSRAPAGAPSYALVDELLTERPLVVPAHAAVDEVARQMTAHDQQCAVVGLEAGRFALVTDEILRRKVVATGREPAAIRAEDVMEESPTPATLGDSAAETLVRLIETRADVLPVTDAAGELRGLIRPRDFAVSATATSVSLHEQLRRATTPDELRRAGRKIPATIAELLASGLSSGKAIAFYSALIDTTIRRALDLIVIGSHGLDPTRFTWLVLGSNGRREAVLSSDVDSAAVLDDDLTDDEITGYIAGFADVDTLMREAGLSGDSHGATAGHRPFARRRSTWRAASAAWAAAPMLGKGNGAMMTSLLADGRVIHGTREDTLSELHAVRQHPGALRVMLELTLGPRPRHPRVLDVLTRRADTYDVKHHAILPVVNMARWAALLAGSDELSTTARLAAAGGTTMLSTEHAERLQEVFAVLQRIRLRYQILQVEAGQRPSDVLTVDQVSPIDRSVITEAVREVVATQRRMANVASWVEPEGWVAGEQPAGQPTDQP